MTTAPDPVVWREPVLDAWIDYNGHLSEPYYVLVFGHATDAVMDLVGLGPAYRDANDASLYTVEAHVRYLDEVSAGSDLEVRSSVIGATGKLLWIWHELWVDGRLRATEEILGVHVVGRQLGAVPRRRRGQGAGRVRRAARGGRRPDPAAGSAYAALSTNTRSLVIGADGRAEGRPGSVRSRSGRQAADRSPAPGSVPTCRAHRPRTPSPARSDRSVAARRR